MAGALLPVKVPNIELVIFDKNDDVGGTWHENRYVIRSKSSSRHYGTDHPSDIQACDAIFLPTFISQVSRQTLSGLKNTQLDQKSGGKSVC
jgi:cation diffusion facilitator CzcD-associated flavoprotein CzcO